MPCKFYKGGFSARLLHACISEVLDGVLRQFPSVKREQAVAALELARTTLLAGARPS
jgi:hypothetical protein